MKPPKVLSPYSALGHLALPCFFSFFFFFLVIHVILGTGSRCWRESQWLSIAVVSLSGNRAQHLSSPVQSLYL